MWAYIYVKTLNKYLTVAEDKILNFVYSSKGHQDRKFASRPFVYIGEKKSYVCQILIVADTRDEVNDFIKDQRPQVPKLSKSDLEPVNPQLSAASNKEAKKKNKEQKIRQKKNIRITSDQILKTHLSYVASNAGSSDPNKSSLPAVEIKGLMNTNHEDDDIPNADDLPENNNEGTTSNNDVNILEINKKLKLSLENEIAQKNQAIKISNEYQKKWWNLQQKVTALERNDESQQNKTTNPSSSMQVYQGNSTEQPTVTVPSSDNVVFLIPINTGSGIKARADAVDTAYSKVEPSKFYEHMCYATWGYKDLALRCVKKPKEHKMCNHWEYPKFLCKVYIHKINTYAHRAIVNAKSHMKIRMEENLSENEEDTDVHSDVEECEI